MRWFRFYDEVLDDPKIQKLPAHLFKHWVNILCIASRSSERGKLPALVDIVFAMRLSEEEVRAVLADLKGRGLLDQDEAGAYTPHDWAGRQFLSDDVAVRVRRHRNRDDVTLHSAGCNVTRNVSGNGLETFHVTHQNQTRPEPESYTRTRPDQTRPDARDGGESASDASRTGGVGGGGGFWAKPGSELVSEGFPEAEVRRAIADLELHPTSDPPRSPVKLLRSTILRLRQEGPVPPAAVPPVATEAQIAANRAAKETERAAKEAAAAEAKALLASMRSGGTDGANRTPPGAVGG